MRRVACVARHPSARGWWDDAQRVRQELPDALTMTARLTRDFPRHVRRPIPPDLALGAVRRHLQQREARFLATIERAVYAHPQSPYLALLRAAGCEYGDVRQLVADDGVEGALRVLADRGVYVAFDELQGRREIVRGSFRLAVSALDFENPHTRPHVAIMSSGSSGRARRLRNSLPLLREWATSISTTLTAHGVLNPRWAFWWTFPATWIGVTSALGHPVAGWFHPIRPLPRLVMLAAIYLRALGKVSGYPIPTPRFGDPMEPGELLAWVVETIAPQQPLVMLATPSAAVRLCVRASSQGVRLDGLTFLVVGEPITPSRRADIEAAGARAIPSYSSTDAAGISYGCATPTTADDLHLMTDRFALVLRERTLGAEGATIDAGLVTCLSAQSARIVINAELGETMHVETRDCDCLLGRLGLRTHLSEVRSFEKLTGEGASFARSSLLRILEEVLPARFGGSSLDYQLAELQEGSVARLVLRVHPAIGPIDEAAIRTTFLDEIGRGSMVDRYQATIWRQQGTIEVRREPPLATRAGKVLPFHTDTSVVSPADVPGR